MTDLNPEFGDSEPEDAWDPGDPTPVLLDNLVRRALLLTHERVEQGDDPAQVLDRLADLVARARQRRLEGRELIRARDLDDDITFLRGRL